MVSEAAAIRDMTRKQFEWIGCMSLGVLTPICAVQDNEGRYEPPCLLSGKEIRVNSTRVIENKCQYPAAFLPCGAFAIRWTEFHHAPERES